MSNARFSNNDRKRRWRIVLEDRCNLFKIGCGLIGIIGVQLDFKRTPRAVVKLDDGVDFPAIVVLIMVKLRVDGFCIYLKITNFGSISLCLYLLLSIIFQQFMSAL